MARKFVKLFESIEWRTVTTDVSCYSSINPLLPSAPYMRRTAKILVLISYKCRDYESVDVKSLS